MTYDILQLQSNAEYCLQLSRSYLISKTLKTPDGWGLQQYLDEIRPGGTYLGVYGTSCGATTLLACGETKDSPILRHFREWLIKKQEKDGGWTISTFRSKDILTTSTCYVMNALNDVGETFSSSIIQEGLNWLQTTKNPDFGWGNYQNDTISHLTPTAHVILTFSRYPEMLNTQVMREGTEWLLKSRNSDYGWGQNPTMNSPSTKGHTALAMLALLCAGYPPHSAEIQKPLERLLDGLEPNLLHTEDEVFSVNHHDGTLTSTHYHLPSLSVVLRTLVLSGVDPLSQEVTQLARVLVSQQEKDGYWFDATAQGKIPIWATMYACLALKEFIKKVSSIRETLGIRQTVVDINMEVQILQSELKITNDRIANLEKMILPLSSVLFSIRKYRVFIILIIAVLAYILFLVRFDVPLYVNIASGIFGALLTLLGIYDSRHSKN